MKSGAGHKANPGGRPRRDEIEGRLFHLLDTAAELFIEHGYAGTSIDGIASAAKIGKPTIYARYGNKAGLLKAVVDHVLKHRTRPIDRPLRVQSGVGALKEQMANLLTASLDPAYVGLFRLYLTEGRRFPDLFDAFSVSGEPYRLLVELLEKHEEFRDLLPCRGELASTLLSLNGMVVTTAAVEAGYRETVSPEREASRFVDICLYGFFGSSKRAVADPTRDASR